MEDVLVEEVVVVAVVEVVVEVVEVVVDLDVGEEEERGREREGVLREEDEDDDFERAFPVSMAWMAERGSRMDPGSCGGRMPSSRPSMPVTGGASGEGMDEESGDEIQTPFAKRAEQAEQVVVPWRTLQAWERWGPSQDS